MAIRDAVAQAQTEGRGRWGGQVVDQRESGSAVTWNADVVPTGEHGAGLEVRLGLGRGRAGQRKHGCCHNGGDDESHGVLYWCVVAERGLPYSLPWCMVSTTGTSSI